MIGVQDAVLDKLIVHRVGNKSLEEGYKLSDVLIDLHGQDEFSRMLGHYFLSPFENAPLHHFYHVTNLDLNEVFTIARFIFQAPRDFVKHSKEAGRILYEYSVHPRIKNGELYVAHFTGLLFEGKQVDAVGLFKSEQKETFLKLLFDGHNFLLDQQEGMSMNKLEKGCLVLHTQEQDGYLLAVIDNTSKGADAVYWKDEFLKTRPANDDYHATRQYMEAARSFVTDQLEQEYEVNKTDKINFLNKTVAYFKQNDAFDEKEFMSEVFEDKEVIQSFSKYKEEYALDTGNDLAGNFDISGAAVKKQARVFKSVLKLDKNFHVYIHGDKSLIEKGYDPATGKHFYKIFFDEES